MLTELLCRIDSLDEPIARFAERSQAVSAPFAAAGDGLDTMPGIARQAAAIIVAEVGTDMRRLPSADHLASWAGVAPGTHESAGTRTSGETRNGNRRLRTVSVPAAHAAARTRST